MRHHPIPYVFGLVLTIAILAGLVNPALAFVQSDGHTQYDIPLQQFDITNYRATDASLAAANVGASLKARYGGSWMVHQWNPQTGTPRHIIGTGAQLGTSVYSAEMAESMARDVIADNATILGADPDQLKLARTENGLGKWTATFQQTFAGIDVWQGLVRLSFTEEGRLNYMGSTFHGNLDLNPIPSLSKENAAMIARGSLPFNRDTDYLKDEAQLLVLPVPLNVDEESVHLVWRVTVHTENPLGDWVTHVDAHTGNILWRYNDIHFLDFNGTTGADIEPGTYCNPIESQNLSHLNVTISGVGGIASDANGDWTIPYAGTDPHTVTATLDGPYIGVDNMAGANAYFSGTATPGTLFSVYFDDGNAQRDERDVFDAINDIHEFFQDVDPTFGYANNWIDANVSINQYCNAYWNGTINFYRAGGGCGNTGQIQGVAHHEFGHGIQDALIGWQGDQGLGEGNGDIIANLMTLESIIGLGFNNCTTGIRNSDNNNIFPDDVIGQGIHYAGQTIAGFHWDLMIGMQEEYGVEQGTIEAAKLWHFARKLYTPTTQPDQVLATFLADDDDGDVGNGTPHYSIICRAAVNHNFACPEIRPLVGFVHSSLTSRETEGSVDFLATVASEDGTILPETVVLKYTLNGNPLQELFLTPTGQPDEYIGTLNGLLQPTEVAYYLQAADDLGNVGTLPTAAPAATFEFSVALVVDELESDTGWLVNIEGSDNATTGIWVRVDPNGTEVQPEDDHTRAPGTLCWVTGNAAPGSGVGVNDVDGGTTTVYSPVYDLTDATIAKVKYWRWYSNTGGADPYNDNWSVQARNNGGAWQSIEYNMDDMNMWVYKSGDLYALFGDNIGNVQIKFIAADLGDGSIIEAAMDDFEVLAQLDQSDVISDETGSLRFALHGSSTNPVIGRTQIRFQVPATSGVSLKMFDVTGRNIATLADETFTAGDHQIDWDGTADNGQPVASGVYFVRMQAPGFNVTRTIVVSQ